MATEDSFTPSVPWCPQPQWWHADDGDVTEDEVTELVAAFVRALQPDVVVETGSYLGHTSQAIGIALSRNRHGRLWTVEIDHSYADRVRMCCTGLPVEVVTGDSLAWEMPGNIGFAWIDSGLARGAEIARMLQMGWFAKDAIVGVHDAGPQHPFTAQVQPLVDAGHLKPITLHTPRGVMFAEVHQ